MIVALALLSIFLIARNCRLSPKINRLEGQIASQQKLIDYGEKTLRENERALKLERRNHDERVAELNGMVDSSNTVIARLTEKDKTKAERIEELEELVSQSPTAEEKIEYLTTLSAEWKERFTLCTQAVGEKDKIIFSLQEKYEAESLLRH